MSTRQIAITARYSYDYNKSLGYGGFGQVFRGYHSVGSQKTEIAVKVICKEVLDKNRSLVYNQIKLLKQLNQFPHPNLIKFYDHYQHKGYEELFLFFELGLANLQSLLDGNGQKIEQDVAMRYFCDIAHGLCFIHQKGIIHRDIKPVNIVCVGEVLKIIDFGVSRKYFCEGQTNSMTINVGDKVYQAPQVLSSEYDERCDVWSLGLILYQMLTGKIQVQNLEQRNRQLEMGVYNFDTYGLSQLQKNLIERMLVYDYKKRAKMSQIIKIISSTNLAALNQERTQSSLKRMFSANLQPDYLQDYKIQKKHKSNESQNTSISEEQSIIEEIVIGQNMPKLQTSLNLPQRNLTSQQFYSQYDLRLYPKLSTLILNGNQIKSINVTHCSQLKKLQLDDNYIQQIYLRKNTKLQQLSMWRNNLYNTWDFLYKNANLRYLRLAKNKVTSIDISKNPKIETLQLFDNNISNINLKNNKNLKILRISNNKIKQIDLLQNEELQELFISHNELTSLNVQKSPNLKIVNCSYNQLSSINLQQNTNITNLNLSNNMLKQAIFYYYPSFIYYKLYNQRSPQCNIYVCCSIKDKQNRIKISHQLKKEHSSIFHNQYGCLYSLQIISQ